MVHKSSALASSGSSGGSQTPWTSNINAAEYQLNNAGSIDSLAYALDYPNFYQGAWWKFSNSYISASDASLPSGDSARSFEFWVKNTGTGYLLTYGTNSGHELISIYLLSGSVNFGTATSKAYTANSVFPNDSNYHQVIVVYGGSGSVTIYVDDVARTLSSNNISSLSTVLGGTQYLGSNLGSGSSNLFGDGAMFRVFNVALTSTQVASLYNSGLGCYTIPSNISSSNLVAEYTLNGNTNDTSSSAHNGTASNMGGYVIGAIGNGTYSATSTVLSWDYINSALKILANTELTGNLTVSGTVTIAGTSSPFLPEAGGTMAGNINMNGNSITNAVLSGYLPLTAGGGYPITGELVVQNTVYSIDGTGTVAALNYNNYGVYAVQGTDGDTGAGFFQDANGNYTVELGVANTSAIIVNGGWAGTLVDVNGDVSAQGGYAGANQQVIIGGNTRPVAGYFSASSGGYIGNIGCTNDYNSFLLGTSACAADFYSEWYNEVMLCNENYAFQAIGNCNSQGLSNAPNATGDWFETTAANAVANNYNVLCIT